MTTDQLRDAILTEHNAKADEVRTAASIVYGPEGFIFDGYPISATETATRQLLTRVGIPYDFFQSRMNTQERIAVFNRLNTETGNARRLLRFSGDRLYGVVSERYRVIDNIEILDVIESAQDSGFGLKPVRWTLDHDHTRVVLVPDGANVGELTPSITITNSENGLGCLSLWAGVYRWVCTNGMMIPISDITKNRWMHMGGGDVVLPDMGLVVNRSHDYTDRLYYAKTKPLDDAGRERIFTLVEGRFGKKTAEKVQEVAAREYSGAPTMFHAINAITRSAQSFTPTRQSEIELFASSLLAA